MFEPGSLDAVDEHAPHAQLPNDLVQRRFADEEFLRRIRCAWESGRDSGEEGRIIRTEAIQRRADEHKDVALGAAERRPVLVRELVRGDEHAEPADADEDALRGGRS